METGKREFRFTYDEQFTIWQRRDFIVEADTLEEAQEIVRKIRDNSTHRHGWLFDLWDTFDLGDADSDMLWDTMEHTGAIEIRSWENDEVIVDTIVGSTPTED